MLVLFQPKPPPVAVQEVAPFETLQFSVVLPPAFIVVGDADKTMTGVDPCPPPPPPLGATVTRTDLVIEPYGFVQFKVKVVLAVSVPE